MQQFDIRRSHLAVNRNPLTGLRPITSALAENSVIIVGAAVPGLAPLSERLV